MTKKQKLEKVIELLKQRYPDAACSLKAENALQLLIATRLSAQCTDARVNLVTPALFERYKTAEEFANADVHEIEEYIKSCGLYKTKAKSIVEMCRSICEKFDGQVPNTLEQLITLSGIGRKTANLIMGDVYKEPGAVVTDTHLIRISNRLGLVASTDPVKVEFALRKIINPLESSDFCHRIVMFGRDVCNARKPDCANCELTEICSSSLK